MSTRITNEQMTGTYTREHAWRIDPDREVWEVSWLPGQRLDRNQAITAMILAEAVARATTNGGLFHDSPDWPFIDSWASELGLSGPAAVGRLGA